MKNMVMDAALALGLNVTRQTRTAELRQFIRRLAPVDCGKPLIRVGGNTDGGYLLPDDLEGIEYCFSPGVGLLADFESDLANKNIRSFLADYSVDSQPASGGHKFTFDKKFLGANNTEMSFTLKTWRDKYLSDYTGELLLQMDIEGSEYEAIISTPDDVLNSFRIMVIEFHYLEKLFDPFVYTFYRSCFDKILKYFHVVHIHPNNCCGSVRKNDIEIPRVMEFTFYNRSRARVTSHARSFPHALDRDNMAESGPLDLPKCWYQHHESE